MRCLTGQNTKVNLATTTSIWLVEPKVRARNEVSGSISQRPSVNEIKSRVRDVEQMLYIYRGPKLRVVADTDG